MKKLLFAICVLFTWASYAQASPMRRGFNEYYASGVNSPDQLDNLLLWLRGDEAYTNTGCTAAAADTNAVACWKDKSGNGYNFTQSVAANKPAYAASVANLNSQPSLDLESDGGSRATSDWLTGAHTALKRTQNQEQTIIVAYEVESQDTFSMLYSYRKSSGTPSTATLGVSLQAISSTSLGFAFIKDSSTELMFATIPSVLSTGRKHVVLVRKTTSFLVSSITFFVDNVLTADTDVANTLLVSSDIITGTPNVNIGSFDGTDSGNETTKYFDGRIAEVIVYTDRLTDSEVKALHENYLCPRYALC